MLLKKTKTIERQTVTTATKGLATGSWMRVPTTSAEVKAETTSILYDYKYRPIRNYTTNYLGGYTYTYTYSKLDVFSGQLQYPRSRANPFAWYLFKNTVFIYLSKL